MKKKTLIALISAVLIACIAVVGTVAYLTNVQNAIKNVFTIGNVDIELEEEGGEPTDPEDPNSPKNFPLVPNTTMTKDATITVGKTSQDAYIFAIVEETCTAVKSTDPKTEYYTFGDYVDYSFDTANWTKLDGYNNVYYIKYTAPDTTPENDTVYHLIADTDEDDKGDVTVKDLSEELIAAAKDADISLSFQAAAVQAEGLKGDTDAKKLAEAWGAVEESITIDTGKITK